MTLLDVVAKILRGDFDLMQVDPAGSRLRSPHSALSSYPGNSVNLPWKPTRPDGFLARGQDRDQARVDAARDVGADRHVGAQMHLAPNHQQRRASRSLNHAAVWLQSIS